MTRSIAIYGESGVGKTLTVCATFKKAFVLLTDPGGLNSVEANLGFTPAHVELVNLDKPFEEAKSFIQTKLPDIIKKGGYSAVVLDTGTELAMRVLDAKFATLGEDGRRVYPSAGREVVRILRMLLTLPVWTIVIFQEQGPEMKERGFQIGGPRLPGTMAKDIIPLFCEMYRIAIEDDPTTMTARRVLKCDQLDKSWKMKSRHGAASEVQDLDLRPIVHRIMQPGATVPALPPINIRKV